MKQYVTGAVMAATLLAMTACMDDTPPRRVAVTGPHSGPAHEIGSIDTDRGNATDQAQVNYVTGGIGDDERAAIEAEKANYNVHVTSSSTDGAFVEDTNLVIRNKAGVEVLNISAGPLTYVQLPAGSYTVDANHGGMQMTRKLVVSKKATARVHFGWKVASTVSE